VHHWERGLVKASKEKEMKKDTYEVWKIKILTGEKEPVFATLNRAEAEPRVAKSNADLSQEQKGKIKVEYREDSIHRIEFCSPCVIG
jgi:hypothetical protein